MTFHDAIETELRVGGELHEVRDVASKIADNAARLATLFHVFSSTCSSSSSPVPAEDMVSASRIVAWHLSESRRFFGEMAVPPDLLDPARLDTWLRSYCQRNHLQTVPMRTVQQYGPSGLREKAAIEAAMRELIDLGRARWAEEKRTKSIQVNPALLSGGEL